MTASADIDLNPNELRKFYTGHFSYYATLDDVYKSLFTERCLQFISEKMITGAGGFEPDNRVKALIAASAVQLTLGMETWKLNYFEEIEIHPSDFDNADGRLKFSGETNLQGYIKLSWKNFIRGYEISDDNLNLGLHEFSHALRFNSIRGHEQDYFMDHYFNKWMSCSLDAFNDIKNNRPTIFRKYGGTNINEFLSVCIEHYFESPGEIKEKYPLLYLATGILLNQATEPGHTKIGVRNELLLEQNKQLPGFEKKLEIQNRFLKHWTFKLWIIVLIMLFYSISNNGIAHPMNLALSLMVLSIYAWYDYNALALKFDGDQVFFKKGASVFKNRKSWSIPVSQLISIRTAGEEWTLVYYSDSDAFFYEESIHPPKGVNDEFLLNCKRNKIAVLR